MPELLPTRVSYRPDEPVVIDVRDVHGPGALTVWHLGEQVTRADVEGAGHVELGPLPRGGYGVELLSPRKSATIAARTAVEVSVDPRSRLRYGFVADYSPGRDVSAVGDAVRRLHLSGVQFYDWAYRHADLVGGGEEYTDALGQPVALDTVRRLVATVQEAGADALGYAAVYAVGKDEWPAWEHLALRTPDGTPYALGDFLWLVDPAAPAWSGHLVADLRAAVDAAGFDGSTWTSTAIRSGRSGRTVRSWMSPNRSWPCWRGCVRACRMRAWCSTTSTTSRRGAPPERLRTPSTSRSGRRM